VLEWEIVKGNYYLAFAIAGCVPETSGQIDKRIRIVQSPSSVHRPSRHRLPQAY